MLRWRSCLPSRWTRKFLLLVCVVAVIENMILVARIEGNRQLRYEQEKEKVRYVNITKLFPEKFPAPKTTTITTVRPTQAPTIPPTKPIKASPRQPKMTEEEYYRRRPNKVNPFIHKYVIAGENICTEDTRLIIIIHSFHPYKDRRDAIRSTWGTIAKTNYNAGGLKNTSLAFIFGLHKQQRMNENIRNESFVYKDIIQGDFGEEYKNMTLKSLLGLKWILDHCPQAKYLLKSDDDMLINMPYLMEILDTTNMSRSIMGPYNLGSRVYRTGKWGLSKAQFPFSYYPPYESGSAYIISGDLFKDLYETAEYIPPIFIDDVYITGILGKVLGVRHVKHSGFAFWTSKRPGPCDILLNRLVTGTKMTPKILKQLWDQIKKGVSCKAQTLQQVPKPKLEPAPPRSGKPNTVTIVKKP